MLNRVKANQWMGQLRTFNKSFENLSLRDLVIPGSHDSATDRKSVV